MEICVILLLALAGATVITILGAPLWDWLIDKLAAWNWLMDKLYGK